MELIHPRSRYVKASTDKLKFFQSQYDGVAAMRDRYKSEVERAQAELKQNVSQNGGGSESEALARSQEQVPSHLPTYTVDTVLCLQAKTKRCLVNDRVLPYI